MTSDRIATAHYAVLCGLSSDEITVGVTPGPMHVSLLASYLLLHERGWEAIRNMIVADIRGALDLGALKSCGAGDAEVQCAAQLRAVLKAKGPALHVHRARAVKAHGHLRHARTAAQ